MTIAKAQHPTKSRRQNFKPKLGTLALHQAKLRQSHLQMPPSHSPTPSSLARIYNSAHKTVTPHQNTTPKSNTLSHTQTQHPHLNDITRISTKPQNTTHVLHRTAQYGTTQNLPKLTRTVRVPYRYRYRKHCYYQSTTYHTYRLTSQLP
jgi:hypothetical protein